MKTVYLLIAIVACNQVGATDDPVSFSKAVAPVFKKYCISCHNSEDREGELALDTAQSIAKGGSSGPALFPGDSKSSRMVRMMTGQLEPKMPPDDMEGPTQPELERLIAWIDEGAKISPDISLRPNKLTVPNVAPLVKLDPITDMAWSRNGKWLAVARYRSVEILDAKTRKRRFVLKPHPGKVNSVEFSPDSRFVLAASGISGLSGVAIEWNFEKQKMTAELKGHRDVLYSATYSPDGKRIATAGYDRKIVIWDKADQKAVTELTGHNGAVYDLQFSPSGDVLASASGDQTIKLWNVQTGERLDTLGQPLKEQFVTGFHPNGKMIVGAGRDHRIRVWSFQSHERPETNPLLISRFAHEASLIALVFSNDGKLLISSAEDRTIKIWDGTGVKLIASLPIQKDLVFGLALSPNNILAMGRLDGSIEFVSLPEVLARNADRNSSDEKEDRTNIPQNNPSSAVVDSRLKSIPEVEPNNEPSSAQPVVAPLIVSGRLFDESLPNDQDLFRFSAKKGETWILETRAQKIKSSADTLLDVLDPDGNPVPRVRLQAVRDSYFTFRGKDANTSDDFRLHNWEEMELNEYLFCNGEVVRLFLYPRGPDSGFKVYPGFGNRTTYFDTTAITHALQEPCYIVRAFPPATPIVRNGLPIFDLNYENDDDAERKLGRDSKLFFTAPRSGEFLVRVRDSRGFQGENFQYQLTIRRPKPDFSVDFNGKKRAMKKGSGREFQVSATRIDNFQGPIDVRFENIPAGFRMPPKVTIEAGHFRAYGTIHAESDAQTVEAEELSKIKITATAIINGNPVTKDLGKIEGLKIIDQPKIQLRITSSKTGLNVDEIAGLFADDAKPFELVISPGQTVSARIVIKRNQHGGDVDLGKEDSGRNLPHGVFVDNIGLNGLRIIKGQGDSREFFVTAAKWVKPQTRLFHLRANNVEGETSVPVRLKIIAQE